MNERKNHGATSGRMLLRRRRLVRLFVGCIRRGDFEAATEISEAIVTIQHHLKKLKAETADG